MEGQGGGGRGSVEQYREIRRSHYPRSRALRIKAHNRDHGLARDHDPYAGFIRDSPHSLALRSTCNVLAVSGAVGRYSFVFTVERVRSPFGRLLLAARAAFEIVNQHVCATKESVRVSLAWDLHYIKNWHRQYKKIKAKKFLCMFYVHALKISIYRWFLRVDLVIISSKIILSILYIKSIFYHKIFSWTLFFYIAMVSYQFCEWFNYNIKQQIASVK